ncbi:MAG: class I SAM-dependent methyltransferase [Alphaproteobacteria bacterium]
MGAGAARQAWRAGRYAKNARFVSEFGAPLIDLLAPRPGERVLDLGCGDGVLGLEIAARGACVVGVDAAPDMVAAARERGIDARVMDGEALDFDTEFDAVFSNAALHWMRRPEAVIAGVRRALKPGGRFVAEFGGEGNIARVIKPLVAALAARDIDARRYWPWYFPGVDAYRDKLNAAGFEIADISLFPRPTPIPGALGDWLDTFAESFLAAVPAAGRATLKADVTAALRPELCDADGRWTLDYVRLRVVAGLPGPE